MILQIFSYGRSICGGDISTYTPLQFQYICARRAELSRETITTMTQVLGSCLE